MDRQIGLGQRMPGDRDAPAGTGIKRFDAAVLDDNPGTARTRVIQVDVERRPDRRTADGCLNLAANNEVEVGEIVIDTQRRCDGRRAQTEEIDRTGVDRRVEFGEVTVGVLEPIHRVPLYSPPSVCAQRSGDERVDRQIGTAGNQRDRVARIVISICDVDVGHAEAGKPAKTQRRVQILDIDFRRNRQRAERLKGDSRERCTTEVSGTTGKTQEAERERRDAGKVGNAERDIGLEIYKSRPMPSVAFGMFKSTNPRFMFTWKLKLNSVPLRKLTLTVGRV